MKKTTLILTIAILAVGALACSSHETEQASEAALTGIRLETINSAPIARYYEAPATVRSVTVSPLSAKVVGTVTQLLVREGDPVRAGQVLMTIDNRDANAMLQAARAGELEAEQGIAGTEAAVAAAEAQRKLANATLERFKTLRERNSVSPQEYEEVEARTAAANAEADRAHRMLNAMRAKREQARAGAAGAEAMMSYTRITAPMNGVVTARMIDVGAMAAPGMPLLTIEDDRAYRIEAQVAESQVGTIRRGDVVRVRIDALGREVEGQVAAVAPGADPASRSYLVKVDLPGDAARDVRSGMFAKAYFKVGDTAGMTVPARAVVRRGQLTSVFVIDDKQAARLRLVRTGKAAGERVEILSGLRDGDRIVADPTPQITDGTRIEG
ncbi:MAG: efflux RND transporter periplasmic adaptor subunit [Thermoanaerobaculia bacterium]